MSAHSHGKRASDWELSRAVAVGTWRAFVTNKMRCKVIDLGEFETESEAVEAAKQGFLDPNNKADSIIDQAYVSSPLGECMCFISKQDIKPV